MNCPLCDKGRIYCCRYVKHRTPRGTRMKAVRGFVACECEAGKAVQEGDRKVKTLNYARALYHLKGEPRNGWDSETRQALGERPV